MCKHVFSYPEDTKGNYNPDGKTLIGVCKLCGIEKKAYGMRWLIPIEESFLQRIPDGESQLDFIDNSRVIC